MFNEPGDEAEQDAIIAKVLDEIGIETNAKVRNIVSSSTSVQLAQIPAMPSTVGPQASKGLSDTDIEKMLAGLRA